MKLVITILLLVVCFLGYSIGFDYDEDDIRTLVKRQANYYNNYDYYGGTTTVATTTKKLIKKCPTNAAGKRIKCKKKKKRTTTSTTTEEPIGIPQSFLRGPPGINPISFFIGPGSWFSAPEPTSGITTTILSTTTTAGPSNSAIPKTRFGGNFVGLPIMIGGILPTGSPKNSTFSHVPAHFEPGHYLNISVPIENHKLSPAGAMQLGVLPKMMKSYSSTIPTNVDPISGSMDTTTPSHSLTTTGLNSKLGSLVAPIASSGFPQSGLNFFIPNNSTSLPQNTTTTAKPAGLFNATNSISNTTIAPTSTASFFRPGLRDLPMPPAANSTLAISVVTSTITPSSTVSILRPGLRDLPLPPITISTSALPPAVTATLAPSSTTSSSGSFSLGKILLPPGYPIPSLTTASSNLGSLIGKVGVPFGLVTTTVSPIGTTQSVLPSTTTAVSTSTSKTGSGLPSLGGTSGQLLTVSSNSTALPSTTPKLGLLLPLLPGSSVSGTTVSFPSSITVSAAISTSTPKHPLTTNGITVTATTISKVNTTQLSTSTTSKNLATTIGSAENGTSTTKSTGLTTSKKKSSKTTKKKGKKNNKAKKKKQQSKKTTKKAENQQGNKENGNGGKKQ